MIETAVTELIQTAFIVFNGTGNAEPYIIREKRMQQQTLFQLPERPQPTPLQKRHKAMRKALDHAGEAFSSAYQQFILDYLRHGPATAETIRIAYEKTSLPKPPHKRASGGVFVHLRHEGLIEEVGKERSKLYGNDLAKYALVK